MEGAGAGLAGWWSGARGVSVMVRGSDGGCARGRLKIQTQAERRSRPGKEKRGYAMFA